MGLGGRHRLSLDRTERSSLGRKRSVPRTKTVAVTANGHQGAVPPRPSSVRAGIAPPQSGGKRQMRPAGKALSPLFCPFSPCGAQHVGRTGARGVRSPGWSGTAGPPGGAMRAAAPGALGAPVPAHCAHPPRPPLRSSRKTWEQPPGVRHFSDPAGAGQLSLGFRRGGAEVAPRLLHVAAAAAVATCARSHRRTRLSGRC